MLHTLWHYFVSEWFSSGIHSFQQVYRSTILYHCYEEKKNQSLDAAQNPLVLLAENSVIHLFVLNSDFTKDSSTVQITEQASETSSNSLSAFCCAQHTNEIFKIGMYNNVTP